MYSQNEPTIYANEFVYKKKKIRKVYYARFLAFIKQIVFKFTELNLILFSFISDFKKENTHVIHQLWEQTDER